MSTFDQQLASVTRRAFLGQHASGIGRMALGSMLLPTMFGQQSPAADSAKATLPHFAAKAKRVIYLFQSGGPSHVDLFDYSPKIREMHGVELPPSVKGTQRVTGMTAGQSSYPIVAPMRDMKRCGQHGTWISDLLPYTQEIADEIGRRMA